MVMYGIFQQVQMKLSKF